MKAELDTHELEAMLDTWRQSVDLKGPMMDQFRIYLMKHRRQILENLVQTGTGWNQMLRCMTPLSEADKAELAGMRSKVDAFVAWAAAELDALDALPADD